MARLFLSALIILSAPGPGVYAAAFQGGGRGRQGPSARVVPRAVPLRLPSVLRLPGLNPVRLPNSDSSDLPGNSVEVPGRVVSIPGPDAGRERIPSPREAVQRKVEGLAQEIAETAREMGKGSEDGGLREHSTGARIMDLILGAKRPGTGEASLNSHQGGWNWGRPAGDSIRAAVEAENAADAREVVPSPQAAGSILKPRLSETEQRPVKRQSSWSRLLASAAALAPAYFIILPLAQGTPFGIGMGAVVALATLAVAAMPWVTKDSPKWLRQSAGHALFALGLVTLGTGSGIIVGGLAALGGWALVARGRSPEGSSFDDWATIGAFVGALGLMVGSGVALAGYQGILPKAVMAAAYLASPLVLRHLPFFGRKPSAKEN